MTHDNSSKEVRTEAARWAERMMDDSQPLSTAEAEAFQGWIKASDEHAQEFRAHMLLAKLVRDLPAHIRTEMLTQATEDAHERSQRWKLWTRGLAASVVLGLVTTLGWFGYQYNSASIEYVTPVSITRDVTLPDGSIAHLNTRTDLRWTGRSGERRVALREGEALFEVKHDPAHPFTVVLDTSEIRVLGTRFNVRRRDNTEVVVTVLEGTVEVLQKPASGSTQAAWTRTLHANQQLVYNATGVVRDIYASTGANAARWREGILEFEDESLSNIAGDLGRYTDRKIVVSDPHLAQLRLGGQLKVRGDIKGSLGLLERIAPVAVHESGNTFILDYRQGPTEEKH